MTSVGEKKKKKPTQFNPPFLCFSHLQLVSEKNMSGESSVSSSGGNHNVVPYDYSDKKADSGKVRKFNGDPE